MKKQFEEFNRAAKALSSAWFEAPREIDNAIQNLPSFPFDKSFDELSYLIHRWCEDAIEAIENATPVKYVICKTDESTIFKQNWFYQAKDFGENYDIEIFEGINSYTTRHVGTISREQFEEQFFIIPEEMYNLYERQVSEGEGFEEVVELAKKLYDK